MRILLIGAFAATLVGCNCLLPHPLGMESCTDANWFACFDRTAAREAIEPKPPSFQSVPATMEMASTMAAKRPMIAAKAEPSASRVPLPPRSLKTRQQAASNAPADPAKTQANIAAVHPTGGVVAAAPEPAANNKDRPDHSETVPRADAEKTASTSPNEPATGSAQNQPSDTAWVVSETTSPVDYSPLISAVIDSTSGMKDAPNALAVRCSASRTAILLRTEGAWHASSGSEVLVDYQINDQPPVRLHWTVSADGKIASYKDDAVEFLRSLPEGAQLKISVFDGRGPGQEAKFQLAGLDRVRKKIGLACKWPLPADKMSSGKR
jgi:hypothetical protein